MSKKRLDLQMFADASAQLQNTTGAAGMTAEMKTYYEKTLLDLAEPALVHDQFGDSYPIPANNGKTIEFRKYDALPKATTPLTEGVTPAGQALNVTTVTAEVHQYGGWVPLTDMLDLTAIDNNIVQATNVLASQGGRTMDTIVRDILNGGTNVIYTVTFLMYISSVWMRPSLMPSTAAAPPCSLPPTMCTSGGAWPEKGGFEP